MSESCYISAGGRQLLLRFLILHRSSTRNQGRRKAQTMINCQLLEALPGRAFVSSAASARCKQGNQSERSHRMRI